MIHAVRSKPLPVGAARTVGPYFCTKDCSTRLSLSPRVTAAMSSLRMPSEVRAADVIAFEKNLVAAADTHQLVAEFIEARGGIACPHEREDGETEEAASEQAAEGGLWSRRHF